MLSAGHISCTALHCTFAAYHFSCVQSHCTAVCINLKVTPTDNKGDPRSFRNYAIFILAWPWGSNWGSLNQYGRIGQFGQCWCKVPFRVLRHFTHKASVMSVNAEANAHSADWLMGVFVYELSPPHARSQQGQCVRQCRRIMKYILGLFTAR